MTNCKYKLRKLSLGLVSVGTMFMSTTVMGEDVANKLTDIGVTVQQGVGGYSETITLDKIEESQTLTSAQPKSDSLTTEVEKIETEQPLTIATEPKEQNDRSTHGDPLMMEIEKFEVNKSNTDIKLIDGKDGDQKLIANRDEKQLEIAEISRGVKVSENQNELEVTLTAKPQQIDEGAEVIILLDTSKKMTETNFNTAKENIKKLVTTLTSKNTNDAPKFNSRNSVRLISFYHKVNDPISLTTDNVDTELGKVWKTAKSDWDWGVDLQGAIHKARDIFNTSQEKSQESGNILFYSHRGKPLLVTTLKIRVAFQK
ncbi:vWA domain-containing protein [Streptococcus phocae subsp. salmonis]|uniref:vWA domain-containing protein n=1 Tax=Streptococcus phocae TaxID=119224 RepID=UPI000531F2C7|nr:vWA domain-containing protein [Streptococcus phocae]KGR72324.1 hypothetical protein NX86_06905 [Streptococcus phocae subsp. salmonis]